MSQKHFYQDQNQKPGGPAQAAETGVLNQNKIDFPPPHEVAGRAYTHYLNQGSQHGNDIEHWLNAESELLAERNRTRTHGYPNPK